MILTLTLSPSIRYWVILLINTSKKNQELLRNLVTTTWSALAGRKTLVRLFANSSWTVFFLLPLGTTSARNMNWNDKMCHFVKKSVLTKYCVWHSHYTLHFCVVYQILLHGSFYIASDILSYMLYLSVSFSSFKQSRHDLISNFDCDLWKKEQ